MIKKNDLTIAIIAGGSSSRFREPKELFVYKGQPLLLHALHLAKRINYKIILITNRNDQSILPPDIPTVPDIKKNCGPLGGIYTALVHSVTPYIAVMPCDMPGLSSNLYELLYRERHSEIPVALTSEKGVEPMVSIWPKILTARIKEFILSRNFEMRKVLADLDAKIINIQYTYENYQPDLFLNINSKKDLDPAKSKIFKPDKYVIYND